MNFSRLILFVAGSVVLAQAAANPITLLDITGSGTSGTIADKNEAIAAEFTLGQSYSDVAISADLSCVGCTGGVYLMQNAIGPTASLADLITASAFNANSSVSPLLSGLSLSAGDYFVVVSISTTGAGWVASNPATITSVAGVSAGGDYFSSAINQNEPYASDFSAIDSPAALMFTVTAANSSSGGGSSGGGTPVPEPSCLGLVALALGFASAARWRRPYPSFDPRA